MRIIRTNNISTFLPSSRKRYRITKRGRNAQRIAPLSSKIKTNSCGFSKVSECTFQHCPCIFRSSVFPTSLSRFILMLGGSLCRNSEHCSLLRPLNPQLSRLCNLSSCINDFRLVSFSITLFIAFAFCIFDVSCIFSPPLYSLPGLKMPDGAVVSQENDGAVFLAKISWGTFFPSDFCSSPYILHYFRCYLSIAQQLQPLISFDLTNGDICLTASKDQI